MNDKLSMAFKYILTDIEKNQKEVVLIAETLRVQGKRLKDNRINNNNNNNNNDNDNDNLLVKETTAIIAQQSASLSHLIQDIFEKEVRYIVPAIAKLVQSKEQIKINNKILRKLGVFESRAILVGMDETLKDDNYGNKRERVLFENEIPYIPRTMIPRWKRTLYTPQAGMLEESKE